MTREPDRYEEKAKAIVAAFIAREDLGLITDIEPFIAAALRREREDALNEAADCVQWADEKAKIRALASPAAAPAAETCKAAMVEDGYPYRCTLPPRHAGPHKENDYAEWDNTADVAQVAPPSEPVAPEKEIANLLGRGHVRNPREGEPGDAETYSSPAPLLPRVLAALEEGAWILRGDARRSLAAELRAYIAERERDDTNVPDDIDPRNFEKYDAEAQKRIAELEAALTPFAKWPQPFSLEDVYRAKELLPTASPAAQGRETRKP